MFITNKDLIEVKIYYKQDGYKFLALTQEGVNKRVKERKLTEDQIKDDFKVLTVNMAILSWGMYNELQTNSTQMNAQGEKYFNYQIYKEDRLKKLIKSWDAADAQGKPVPVNETTIMSIAPTIGDAIVKGYDEASFYDEDAEKK